MSWTHKVLSGFALPPARDHRMLSSTPVSSLLLYPCYSPSAVPQSKGLVFSYKAASSLTLCAHVCVARKMINAQFQDPQLLLRSPRSSQPTTVQSSSKSSLSVLLKQTLPSLEIIVSDDNSDDATIRIVEATACTTDIPYPCLTERA
jgi:hypothetical protein